MAIAFDASSNTELSANLTSYSQSHTCSGSNRILFVGVNAIDTPYNQITGVTYNGVSMTLIDSRFKASDRGTYLYRLIAPATGANNITVSASSGTRFSLDGISFTGVDQTTPIDVSTTQESASTTITQTVTVANANSFLVSSMFTNRNQTASTNTTLAGTAVNNVMFYSTTSVGTGSQSLVSTQSDSTWTISVMAALKEASAGFTPNPLMHMRMMAGGVI